MKYRHLIFDIDGTLVDNEKAVIFTWQETIAQLFGRQYAPDDLDFVLGIPGETTMQRLGADHPKEAFEEWGRNFQRHRSEIELFPYIEQMILKLKSKGVRLGIVTSRTRSELDNDDALCRIIGNFDTVICVTDTPRPKPFPDPLLAYLSKSGIAPADALYIGDSDYDRQCAAGAGVDFGLALWGQKKSSHAGTTFRFENPLDILLL